MNIENMNMIIEHWLILSHKYNIITEHTLSLAPPTLNRAYLEKKQVGGGGGGG